MRVAITGGSGFIGQHVAQEVRNLGHEVVTFDLRDGNDILGDLSGLDGCDSVIHLAGLLGTMEMFDFVADSTKVNVWGTARIAEWCSRNDAQLTLVNVPFVFPSIYRATKEGAYRICETMNQAGMLKMSSVTVFNAFGPGQHTANPAKRIPRKFTPTWATAAWHNEPIMIWGKGTSLIDPIHTSEVARIFAEATQFNDGQVFDAGSGLEFTVNEVAEFFIEHTGSTGGIEYEPMRIGEAPTNVGATGLGWDLLSKPPEFSWSQLADTIDWYKGKTVVE